MSDTLDLAIVGGGPAGLTAGMYAGRGGLSKVVLFESAMPGGQITSSSEIENYPGVSTVVSGLDFMQSWTPQAQRFGMQLEIDEIVSIDKVDNLFVLNSTSEKTYKAKSVIVCTGSRPKKAGFIGEAEFFGRGVSICATCDGFFYRNKEVVVLGGGDVALEEAHYLAKSCKKVYLVHRRDSFKVAPATVERVMHTENIEPILNAELIEVFGDASGVLGAKVRVGNEIRTLSVPGVFVFVGRETINSTLKRADGTFICDVTQRGEVVVDLRMRTSLKGLFAGGDIRVDAARQVVCAAGDGALAALEAIAYVDSYNESIKKSESK